LLSRPALVHRDHTPARQSHGRWLQFGAGSTLGPPAFLCDSAGAASQGRVNSVAGERVHLPLTSGVRGEQNILLGGQADLPQVPLASPQLDLGVMSGV